jgi:hypothetical protein
MDHAPRLVAWKIGRQQSRNSKLDRDVVVAQKGLDGLGAGHDLGRGHALRLHPVVRLQRYVADGLVQFPHARLADRGAVVDPAAARASLEGQAAALVPGASLAATNNRRGHAVGRWERGRTRVDGGEGARGDLGLLFQSSIVWYRLNAPHGRYRVYSDPRPTASLLGSSA